MYLDGGRWMRVDGLAPCSVPPAPVQVSTLTDIAQVCSIQVVSNLADRAQSELVFRYRDAAGSCAGPAGAALPAWSLPLTAAASTIPSAAVVDATGAIDPAGAIDAVLLAAADGSLVRIASFTDGTVAKTLVAQNLALGPLAYPFATWLGAGRYLVSVLRQNTGLTEVYVYDSNTDTMSAIRGSFGAGPSFVSSARDATYAYFTAAPLGGNSGIYRVRVDGTAAAQLLSGSAAANPYFVRVLGVLNGTLYFTQPGASMLDVRSHPTSIDFASPPAATTIVAGVANIAFHLSTNRLFYGSGNLARSIGLDGLNGATYDAGAPLDPPLASFLGCTIAAVDDVVDPVGVTPCDRVALLTTQNGTANSFLSFDADAAGDTATSIFTSATRDERLLGSTTGYLSISRVSARAAPYLEVSFVVRDTLVGTPRDGVAASFDLADASGFTLIAPPAGSSDAWLLP